jgi:paraquat-inducible protein B
MIPKKRTHLSLVWLIPMVAVAVGAWVAVTRILGQGPRITIVFKSAEGLEAGKTKIHYNGVDVGTITEIRLSDDHRQVVTAAQMAPETESFLVQDTTFWVVSPRISGANVTGLGTLISGAYIGMEIGSSAKARRAFAGLETPPVVTGDVVGRFFRLKAPDLGSLDTGTPLFLRRLQVGQVASYALDEHGQSLTIRVFVTAPYDQYVNPNTRFWQASGIDLSLTANGLAVQTQSVLSILVGGIAFETPAGGPVLPPAAAEAEFPLFGDRAAAFKLTARDPQTFVLEFTDSVRGLAAGAPVEFRGIQVGEVVEVAAQLDARTFEFSAPVTVVLDATRLGVEIVDLPPDADTNAVRRRLIDDLVAHGVRAQLRTGNLVTGAMLVAFDFFPGASTAEVDWAAKPPRLPTTPGDIAAIEAKVVSIIDKLDKLPIEEIGDDLRRVIADLDKAIVSAGATLEGAQTLVGNADRMIEPGSVLGAQLGSTLEEVSRAARGLRLLADYLERHPEALLRGKPGEPADRVDDAKEKP